jgi:hypothetical protein
MSRAAFSRASSSLRDSRSAAGFCRLLRTAGGDSVTNQSIGLSRALAIATSSVAETLRLPASNLTTAVRSSPTKSASSACVFPLSSLAWAIRRPKSA